MLLILSNINQHLTFNHIDFNFHSLTLYQHLQSQLATLKTHFLDAPELSEQDDEEEPEEIQEEIGYLTP